MNIHSSAKQTSVVIAGVGTWFPHQSLWTSFDSAIEFVPETAETLISAVAAVLGRSFEVEPNALRIRTRLSASPLVPGLYDARATILFRPSEDGAADELARMRSAAARVLAAAAHPAASRLPGAEFLSAEEMEFPTDALLESPFAPFLGTRISNDLVAHVPGRPTLTLKHQFRERPLQTLSSETFEVIGKIHDRKLGGLFRSVFITGFRWDNSAEVKRAKVFIVNDDLRAQISRVVREPSRRLRLTVTSTEVCAGNLARGAFCELQKLRFDDDAQT